MAPTILFFDGYCTLCNASVDFVLRHDKACVLKVASLQGQAAREHLPETLRESLDSLVLFHNGRIYTESTAALKVAGLLGFPWTLATVFLLVPPFIRNAVYRWVARNRYRWFGKRDTCRLPTAAERARFLD
jgi:predicted DCC family thiol-disulfide oxidoreductase YuxK